MSIFVNCTTLRIRSFTLPTHVITFVGLWSISLIGCTIEDNPDFVDTSSIAGDLNLREGTGEDTEAGERAGENAGENAGANAGENAGANAGESAGANAGENAGANAGENAGANAGANAGENAGEDAGENAGEDAGENAGEDAGGSMISDQDGDGVSAPDDCDDTRSEISPLLDETCDGLDNDCDGQVDEDLEALCIARIATFNAPADVTELGEGLTLVRDLDRDGHDDVIARGRRNGRVRLIAVSARGTNLWAVNGDGDVGLAIAGGDLLNDGQTYVVISDPDNDRAVVYDQEGRSLSTFAIDEGVATSLVTLSTPAGDQLMMGIPESGRPSGNRGTLKMLRFDNLTDLSDPIVVYEREGERREERGERLFNIGDFDGDGVDDVVFTRRVYFNEEGGDTATMLISAANGEIDAESVISAPDATYDSFANDLAWGRFSPNGGVGFIFSAPRVSIDAREQGALYPLLDDEGFSFFEPIYGAREAAQVGLSLATISRPERSRDELLVGASGVVFRLDLESRAINLLITEEDEEAAGLSVGSDLITSRDAGPDGTRRLWVSGVSAELGESLIWVYSVR